MRIVQIMLPGASLFEQKSQRIDREALTAAGHQVIFATLEEARATEADLAHVYAPRELPSRPFVRFPLPYVSNGRMTRSRFSLRRPSLPVAIVSPVAREGSQLAVVPEAIEDGYFQPAEVLPDEDFRRVGVFIGQRGTVKSMMERTGHRIARFRDDIHFVTFDTLPLPVDLRRLHAWADLTTDEEDTDGFTAEALASGLIVIAARTPLNQHRLEQGRCGFLVPQNDANETTHAILTALFKTEVAQQKSHAGQQTISKFKPRQRLRALVSLYESLNP